VFNTLHSRALRITVSYANKVNISNKSTFITQTHCDKMMITYIHVCKAIKFKYKYEKFDTVCYGLIAILTVLKNKVYS